VIACVWLAATAARAVTPGQWEVTVAARVTGGSGRPATIRIALPGDGAWQRITNVDVTARGLTATRQDEPTPHVRLRGKLAGARRIAVTYRVTAERDRAVMPRVTPVPAPTLELLPFLSPAPLFQSRSILVRDFLETHVTPLLAAGATDLLRAIFTATRRELARTPDGHSLPLDVIRRRQGKRIGIERAFTTFLRCAGIPARFVEGIDLRSRTRRKRAFWTEVWAQDRWWPVSASGGWIGRLPEGYLAVARDGDRILEVDEPLTATYTVLVRRLTDH
jgi:transglutaminase-like putative cysteine protease